MDKNAVNPGAFTAPILNEAGKKLSMEYARLSATPDGFAALQSAVETMQKTEPNYGTPDLSVIRGPRIAIADADHEEFIPRSHTVYLARTIPGAQLIFIHGGSHFTPWQVPAEFNRSLLRFLQSPR
jgi:pimeloyl-ACP methyl ester carboxylesterase